LRDQTNLATRPGRRLRRWLGRGVLVVAALYLLLLIPGPRPPTPTGAGKSAFVWNRDAFWSELERQFVAARSLDSNAVSGQILGGLFENTRLLDVIASTPFPPQSDQFARLETNLFRLAPLVAACPGWLPDYSALISRTRREVKRQSQRWDLNSDPARACLYRLIYGGRAALEEVMLQAAATTSISPVLLETHEPSRTPAVEIHGVTLHSGDVLVSRGGAPTSALIARGNDYPGNFSHVALLYVDATNGKPSVIESHIECGVAVATLEEYLHAKKLRILVLRPRADLPLLIADPLAPHKAATAALAEANGRHIPYDFAMDYQDHREQFCSEVASAAYETVNLKLWMDMSFISAATVTAWLGSLGVRHFETQEPADLEFDPQLCVVAEWRDPATLFKAHVDDAVTDAMLERAAPGRPLDYSLWRLPLARLGKGYSVLLNKLGRVGPIPEGMGAATALRVDKYLGEHEALTARVLVLAESFKSKHGYPPPYWELLKLAREACRE
jgi:permuted papain-like amidase YaeF/Yiix C92 family enzyme